MASPPQILRELCEAAVLWRRTKNVYLQMLRSRNPNAETARKAHMQAVEKLDKAIQAFEGLGALGRRQKREKKPINWKKMIDGVAGVASALSKATDNRNPIIEAKVIDMPTETP